MKYRLMLLPMKKTINITDGTDTHSIPFPFSPAPIYEAVYLQSSGSHYGPCFDLQDSCQGYKPQTGKYITVRERDSTDNTVHQTEKPHNIHACI